MAHAVNYDRPEQLRRSRIAETKQEIQHIRFGGMHFGTAFFGWLVANSISILLIAILSALGTAIALTTTNDASDITSNAAAVSLAGGASLLIVLGLAYFAGGYVAGRMNRFDGAKQGIAVWMLGIIITLILGIGGAVLGSSYNILQNMNLPSLPIDGRTYTTGGLVTLLAVLVITALSAIAGGKAGERFHHKVDNA